MSTETESGGLKGLPPKQAVVVSAGLVVGLFLGQIAVGAPTTIPDWLMVVALGLSTTVVAWETIRRKIDVESLVAILVFVGILATAFL